MGNTDQDFKLLGHINMCGEIYPHVVLPVGKINNVPFIVYNNRDILDEDVKVERLSNEDFYNWYNFVIYNEGILEKLEGFNHYSRHLFAFSKEDIEQYLVEEKESFFRRVLEDDRIKDVNQNLRTIIAEQTMDQELIFRELKKSYQEYKLKEYDDEIRSYSTPFEQLGKGLFEIAKEMKKKEVRAYLLGKQ